MLKKEKLLPYFVYLIFDPNEDIPFYIGKGTGKRDNDHQPGEKDDKERKIKNIRDRGETEIRVIIGRYKTEAEAFSVEATLIKWVYGFENLTNKILGKNSIFIRPHSQMSTNSFVHMDRIDREIKHNVHTGAYTQELINSIKSNNIMVKLATIKEILVVNFPDLNIQDEQILTAQDPCILISGFSDSVQIQVRMAPKSGTFFTINYLTINSSSKVQFEETIFKLFKVNKVPKGNAYGKYLPYKEKENERFKLAYKDYEKIGEIIKKVLKEFI